MEMAKSLKIVVKWRFRGEMQRLGGRDATDSGEGCGAFAGELARSVELMAESSTSGFAGPIARRNRAPCEGNYRLMGVLKFARCGRDGNKKIPASLILSLASG